MNHTKVEPFRDEAEIKAGQRKKGLVALALVTGLLVLGGAGAGLFFGSGIFDADAQLSLVDPTETTQPSGPAFISATPNVESHSSYDLNVVRGWQKDFHLNIELPILYASRTVRGSANDLFLVNVSLAVDDVSHNEVLPALSPATHSPDEPSSASVTNSTDLDNGIVPEAPSSADNTIGFPETLQAETLKTTAVVPEHDITLHQDVAILSDVQASFNFEFVTCENYNFICVEIYSMDIDIWQWNEDHKKTVCLELGDCLYPIRPVDMEASSHFGDFNVTMGTDQSLSVDVHLHFGNETGNCSLMADKLFDVWIYFSANEVGDTHTIKVTATHESPVVADIRPNSDTDINELTATLDIRDTGCATFPYVCVDLAPKVGAPIMWLAEEDFITDCAEVTDCINQVAGASINFAASAGRNLEVVVGSTKIFTLDVVIVTGDDTAMFVGEANAIFGMSLNMKTAESDAASMTLGVTNIPEDNVSISLNSSVSIYGVNFTEADLVDRACDDVNFVCVDVFPVGGASPEWKWSQGDVLSACMELDGLCTVQVAPASQDPLTMNGNFDVVMGIPNDIGASLAISTSDEKTGILSNDLAALMKVDVFVSGSHDGSHSNGDSFEAQVNSSQVSTIQSSVVIPIEITANLDLSNGTCEEYTHFCVKLSPAPDSGWFLYGQDNSVGPVCLPLASCKNTIKYELVSDVMTYFDARAHCESKGMTLLRFESQEQLLLYFYYQRKMLNDEIYLGWIDANDLVTQWTFQHSDGSPLPFTNWAPGEPNNANGVEDCSALANVMAQWKDFDCHTQTTFTCQRPGSCAPDFICENKRCIPIDWQCDGFDDCLDGSDEVNCLCDQDFACNNGTCLSMSARCDLNDDCPEADDEQYCTGFTFDECFPNYGCPNGNCISPTWRCDTFNDCGDGQDELNCPCLAFECDNGNCIIEAWECDSFDDCGDNSDEADCPDGCNPSQWQCNNGQCIPAAWRCDGYLDCQQQEDEAGC